MSTNEHDDETVSIRSGLPVTSTTWLAQELAEAGWAIRKVLDREVFADAPRSCPLSIYVEYPPHLPAVIGFLWQGGPRPMTRMRQIVAQAAEGDLGPSRPPTTPGQVTIEEWPIAQVFFDPATPAGWLADLIASATEPEG